MWNSRNVSLEPSIQVYVQNYRLRTLREEVALVLILLVRKSGITQ